MSNTTESVSTPVENVEAASVASDAPVETAPQKTEEPVKKKRTRRPRYSEEQRAEARAILKVPEDRPDLPAVRKAKKATKEWQAWCLWFAVHGTHEDFMDELLPLLQNGAGRKSKAKGTLNVEATLEQYRTRLSALPAEAFEDVDGKWLSGYGINNQDIGLVKHGDALPEAAGAFRVISDLAVQHGFTPLGVVSYKHKKPVAGEEITFDRTLEDESTRLYVGPKLAFMGIKEGHTLALLPADYVRDSPSETAKPSTAASRKRQRTAESSS